MPFYKIYGRSKLIKDDDKYNAPHVVHSCKVMIVSFQFGY